MQDVLQYSIISYLCFYAEKLDEKDTHDLEYVRHDIRHSSFTVLEVEKLHFGVWNDHRNFSAIYNYHLHLMCGISSPNINSKPQHICQYTSTNSSKWLNFGGKRSTNIQTFPSLDSNMHFAGTSSIFVMHLFVKRKEPLSMNLSIQ